MKKIMLLFLLISFGTAKAQYVPDSPYFALSDVVSGVCLAGESIDACGTFGTPNSLSECFAVAEYITANFANFFDASYEGSHDRLSNFRNYGGSPCSELPTILTTSMSEGTNPYYQGEVCMTSQGAGCAVTEMGLAYSTSPNPTISGSHASANVSIGSYSWSFTGPTQGTSYYYRAFATNSFGTAYGEQGYLCNRPTGLADILFVHTVNGTSVTGTNICDTWPEPTTTNGYNAETSISAEGSDVFAGYTDTSCDKITDGYYLWGYYANDVWVWVRVYVSAGKWYYQPC